MSSIPSQHARAEAFKALHDRPGIFLAPNPWDAGSAKMLASLGYEALATTSGGLAFGLGRADNNGIITRNETLANCKAVVDATLLPVSADLQNGFGDRPEDCAETILAAAAVGLVGGSIEDATGNDENPIFSIAQSVERVKAAVKAARSLPFHFMFCARADNLIQGRHDLKDTLTRLEAYADAGADVLFAPGLKTREEIEMAVKAVHPKPLNVIMGLTGVNLTVNDLAELGVKRISLGSSMVRAAYTAFYNAAEEMMEHGTFGFAGKAIPYANFNEMFQN